MEALTPEENLVAHVARATCFAYRVDPGEVPESDVRLYVDELISLFHHKPSAVLPTDSDGEVSETLRSAVAFCAEQLKDVAPREAARLDSLLQGSTDG
jgi:hypothetical protein